MPRLPRPEPHDSGQRLKLLTERAPEQVARLRRITAGWHPDDTRWDDLLAALDYHERSVRKEQADRIRLHADDPKVKPHLLEGEWTGLRMAANLLHPEKD
jgi:hypothetical protein